jgi:hypothetical protein
MARETKAERRQRLTARAWVKRRAAKDRAKRERQAIARAEGKAYEAGRKAAQHWAHAQRLAHEAARLSLLADELRRALHEAGGAP